MRNDVWIERDGAYRAMVFTSTSDKPIAYTDHPETKPIKSLLIPDSTMTILEALIKGMDKETYRWWSKPEEDK